MDPQLMYQAAAGRAADSQGVLSARGTVRVVDGEFLAQVRGELRD
jgi:hypothetical protein